MLPPGCWWRVFQQRLCELYKSFGDTIYITVARCWLSPIIDVTNVFSVSVASSLIVEQFFCRGLRAIKQNYPTVQRAVLDLAPRGGAKIAMSFKDRILCWWPLKTFFMLL